MLLYAQDFLFTFTKSSIDSQNSMIKIMESNFVFRKKVFSIPKSNPSNMSSVKKIIIEKKIDTLTIICINFNHLII